MHRTAVRDNSDLKQRLTDTWASGTRNIIDEAVDQWRKRFTFMRENDKIWTSTKLKRFFFSDAPYTTRSFQSHQTVYRGKRVTLRVIFRRWQGKLNRHIIFESMRMLLSKKYQNYSVLVEMTACQSWRVLLRHRVEIVSKLVIITVHDMNWI